LNFSKPSSNERASGLSSSFRHNLESHHILLTHQESFLRRKAKNRSALKNMNPLNAAEGYVVRQRSTVLREDQDQDPETSSG